MYTESTFSTNFPSGLKIQYSFPNEFATQMLPVFGSMAGHQVWQHGVGCCGPLLSQSSLSTGRAAALAVAAGVDVVGSTLLAVADGTCLAAATERDVLCTPSRRRRTRRPSPQVFRSGSS